MEFLLIRKLSDTESGHSNPGIPSSDMPVMPVTLIFVNDFDIKIKFKSE
jgi:hypothetical protein